MHSSEETSRRFPARQGIAWFSESILLLRRDPFRILLLGLVLQLIGGVTQIGVLGLLFFVAVPALTAGMLLGLQQVDGGHRPAVSVLFAAFGNSARLPRLLLLGLLMLVCVIFGSVLTTAGSLAQLDQELLARLQQGDTTVLEQLDPMVLLWMLAGLVMGVAIGTTLAFFAVPLVWFGGLPLGKSIAVGLKAMLKNWRPLLVLGLLVGVITVPVALLAGSVMMTGASTSGWMTVIVMLVIVLYQLLMFSIQYITFRDIFGAHRPVDAVQPSADQLVA